MRVAQCQCVPSPIFVTHVIRDCRALLSVFMRSLSMRFAQPFNGVGATPTVEFTGSEGRLDTILRYIYLKIGFTTYREIICIIIYITFSDGAMAAAGSVISARGSWTGETWAAAAAHRCNLESRDNGDFGSMSETAVRHHRPAEIVSMPFVASAADRTHRAVIVPGAAL